MASMVQSDSRNVLVSICCITYNQEAYIRDALEGFVKQKTNFRYEVLIHDDASTDRTAEIIREYEEKYPDLIKPILQTVNQYSLGLTNVSGTWNFPRAVKNGSKYIAMCEGDDYWIDEHKLQRQVDYLEAHLHEKLTVADVAKASGKSETAVKKLFSLYREGGIMRYFTRRKIKQAKRLIREGRLNFSQIAETLGFDTPQYFSRCFKQVAHMTPGEYRRSVMK